MTNFGTGVMLHMLSDNSSTVQAVNGSLGKRISKLFIDDNTLNIEFEDNSGIKLYDAGQSCCEHRYMSTDDDLPYYAGATLVNTELRNAPNVNDNSYGEHEVQFLVLVTDRGNVTFANHNEHNGYYGGFAVVAEEK